MGISLVTVAFYKAALPLPTALFDPATDPFQAIRWPFAVIGVVCLVVLGVIGPLFWLPSPNLQLALFFGGILALLAACWPAGVRESLRGIWQQHRWECGLVLGLTLLAFAVRVYRLEGLFPLIYADEAPYLRGMRRMYEGESRFLASHVHNAALYLFSHHNALWFYAFGESLFAARFTNVLVGSLAIPSVYLAARRVVGDWRAGALAALLLLAQPVHVHFSRYGVNNIIDPTLGLLGWLLLWSALQYGGLWRWAGSAALLGWSQYYYTGAALWLMIIPTWAGLLALRHPIYIKRWLKGGIVFGAVFGLLLLPRLVWYWADPSDSTLAHFNEVAFWRVDDGTPPEKIMEEQVTPSVRAFVDQVDRWPHFEPAPNARSALTQPLGLLCFSLGLAFAGRYALHPGVLAGVLWLILGVFLGGVLTATPPSFARYITMTLPMAWLGGLGLAGLARMNGRWWAWGGVFSLAILTAGADLHYSWVEHPGHYLNQMAPEYWLSDRLGAASRQAQSQGWRVYWLVEGDPFFNARYWQGYQFYTGLDMRPFIISEGDIGPFLAGLETQPSEIVLFVRPQGPAMRDLTTPILTAYPDAIRLLPYSIPQEYTQVRGMEGFTPVLIPQGAQRRGN
jgi:hypothetical protein